MKIFENLEHKVAQKHTSRERKPSADRMECILVHHSMLEGCCNATGIPTTRRIDAKERSRLTITSAKNDGSLFLWREVQ